MSHPDNEEESRNVDGARREGFSGEEKVIQAEYMQWRKNVQYLYDIVINHAWIGRR